MTCTAPPRGDIQPVVAEWWMLTYEPASQPASPNESWWLGDRSAAIRRQGRRLPSELWRPWGDLGRFDGEDIRCVGRKGQTAECRTLHGRVCRPRRRRKQETRRGMRGKNRERGDEKVERKGRGGQRKIARTVAATTSYTNATSYWFSGEEVEERGWNGGGERKRETERRWKSVQGGETEREAERRKRTERPVLRR